MQIVRDIGTIARALDSIANIEFKEIELSKNQYMYLVRIYENPGIIQEKLAELCSVDRTTVSRAVKKLVSKGFVYQKQSEGNRKNLPLFVTEKGSEIYPEIIRENDYSNQVALSGLSEKETQEFTRLLRLVRRNVTEDWQKVKKGKKRIY